MDINEFFKVDFWEMILRTTLSFIVLLILARLLGKKQMSQLTFFNYITGITIGSIAADIAGETKTPFFNGLISLIWWSALTALIGYIGMKSSKSRILIDDEPTIVIKEGKILENAMKSIRLNIDDLSMLLREQGVFSTQDVNYAILEPNGKLSILKKINEQTATKKDLNITSAPPSHIPTEVIADGKLLEDNLKRLNVSKGWINKRLKDQGIHSVEEVFYGEIQPDGSLYIDLKSDQIK
ncbi:hypothetical protein BEH_24575 (plasmid) [Priestia filamentosa]|uniref:DUF421 domain-containing protein n=1 Tax=Priestia filamentosa TaxID=1402861 RepID=A0A2L1FFN7_9BACI|nr:DUF421 domain-containing protein [Priestia filamentosa]AVD54542.1 DUF421 domain-containing protein [Priestia filamentosa]AWG44878.1 hypothetical protein BEH_24575 [Priestia filamentosa]